MTKNIMQTKQESAADKALEKFRKDYPFVDVGQMQAFLVGYNEGKKDSNKAIEAQKKDYKDKMECLIGYCELSKKTPKMPAELEMVIDEAKQFIKNTL